MKICWILPSVNMSGGVKVIGIYASLLQALGHDVTLVIRPNPKPSFKNKLSLFLKQGKINRYQEISPNHLVDLNLNTLCLPTCRALTDEDVPDGDVVIATYWTTAKEVADLSPEKGAKFYFMQDYGAGGMELEKLIPTWNLPLNIITIADWLSDLIEKETGRKDTFVVLNGIEKSLLQTTKRCKQPVPTFGFVYREDLVKGYDLILEAFLKIRKVNQNIKFVSFGPHEPATALPEGFSFKHLPSDAETREIYGSCDAWLFASRLEGFGLPIIEAMASGTPVIGTSAGAAPHYINDQTGALVETTADAFAEQILRFSQMSEEEWLQKSTNALQRVSTHTWEDAALLFENILSKDIEKSSTL